MNGPRFSPGAFTLVFCCVYAAVFWMNVPLFLYYPLHGEFAWGWRPIQGVGPAMAWYGLMTDAAAAAVVVAACVRQRLVDALLRGYLWLFPCAAMLTCVFLLRKLFS